MKQLYDYKIKKLAYNDERARGYYNAPLYIEFNGHEVVIGMGGTDSAAFFVENDVYYLLTWNSRHDYANVTVIASNGEFLEEEYFENLNDENSPLYSKRRDFFSLTPKYMLKLMLGWLYG